MPTEFRLVITTQFMENYGAHCWDGKGEYPQYWKYKGGQEYVICEGMSTQDVADLGTDGLQGIVDIACTNRRIIHSDDYSRSYLIDWNLYATGEETPDEKMEREYKEEFKDYMREAS